MSNDRIPGDFAGYIATWKRLLPDYEFMLWDCKRFNLANSAWVKEAFDHKKYAFAADYIRLYALYEHGGIYFDTDVEVVRSLDPLLNRPYILGYERNGKIEAGIMGAEKQATWLLPCLKYYENRHFVKPDGTLDTQTLPRILSKIITENSFDAQYILPWECLTACSPHIAPRVTKNTYTIHHFAGSWVPPFRRKELLRAGRFALAKIKRRTKKADFLSPDFEAMFHEDERIICSWQISAWKKLVFLARERK